MNELFDQLHAELEKKNLPQCLDMLQQLRKANTQYRQNMLSLAKRQAINVNYKKRKIRTAGWLTGYERTQELKKLAAERARKKAKNRN